MPPGRRAPHFFGHAQKQRAGMPDCRDCFERNLAPILEHRNMEIRKFVSHFIISAYFVLLKIFKMDQLYATTASDEYCIVPNNNQSVEGSTTTGKNC